MDENSRQILSKIYQAARRTNDGFVISVDIGVRGEERERICQNLTNYGYITKLQYLGKDKIQCQITEEIENYFMKESKL